MPNELNIEVHKFKPGQSGNPTGRPKGSLSSKTIIRRWLETMDKAKNPTTGVEEEMTVLDRIVLSQIGKAMKGDTSAFSALLDRVEGKVTQKLEHTGEDGAPILSDTTHRVIFENYAAEGPHLPLAGKKSSGKGKAKAK